MAKPLISGVIRRATRLAAVVAAMSLGSLVPVAGQQSFPPFPTPSNPGAPPAATRSPACQQLESQLLALERGGIDPARAEQVQRYEQAANQQQAELDRVVEQAGRLGCRGRGFFSLFTGEPPQCAQLNSRIQAMRANLDRIYADLEQIQGNNTGRENQRRAIFAALINNNCGQQYQRAARSDGLFGALFGPGRILSPESSQSTTYRTLCVRTCDGYYFPISYATTPAEFAQDELTCQRQCPNAEVMLFTHLNPGQDVNEAVSVNGFPYTSLPNAFHYREKFDPQCSCKPPGETWSEALQSDQTIQNGDVVVIQKPQQANQPPATAQPSADQPPEVADTTPHPIDPNKKVRTVGPVFLPEK